MSRVATLLLVLVVATLGLPSRALGTDEAQIGREVTAAMRELLEQVDSGALSEDELARLLLAGLSATLVRPPVGRLDPPDEALPSVVDEAAEQALPASSATTANGAIMIGTTPVATLASPLVIPAASFTTDACDPDLSFPLDTGYWQYRGEWDRCVVAPAALPRGGTVTLMYATVFNAAPDEYITVKLSRIHYLNGTRGEMASVTSGSSDALQLVSDNSIGTPVVEYPTYQYYVSVCFHGHFSWNSLFQRLYSVRLYFTP